MPRTWKKPRKIVIKMIPKNPITIAINKGIMEKALKAFNNIYLPAYDLVVTSFYRTEQENQDAGGADDSAHMYGLATDYVLKNKTTGKILSDSQMKAVFDGFIKPNWKGYTYFSPKQPDTNTGWIHANLDRGLTKYTMWAGAAALGAGALFVGNKLRQQFKLKKRA